MTDFLQDLVNELGPQFASIASEGRSAAEISGYLDSGCYLLNAVVSGSLFKGFPGNKITAIAGEPATGKTFFAIGIVRHFLQNNPKAQVCYFDTEGAVTKEMLDERDVDSTRVLIIESETIQMFRTQALKMLAHYEKIPVKQRPPTLFVLDSLGMLSTTKEVEDTNKGAETRDMTKAQVIKATFRVLTLKCAKLGVPMIVTNHVYDVTGANTRPGMPPPKNMGGGSGLKYAASSILFLSKGKDYDEKTKQYIGSKIRVRMEKSRLSKENASVLLFLNYMSGLGKYSGLLDLGLKYGIIEKVNNISYMFPNGVKAKGTDIRANPEEFWTADVLQALEPAANKEFMYGSGQSDSDVEDPGLGEGTYDDDLGVDA